MGTWIPVKGHYDPWGIYTLRGENQRGDSKDRVLCGNCLPGAADEMRDEGMKLTMKVEFECSTALVAQFYCSQCHPKVAPVIRQALNRPKKKKKGGFLWPRKNKS